MTIKPTITGMVKLEEVEKEPEKVIPGTTFHKRRFMENEISPQVNDVSEFRSVTSWASFYRKGQ